MTLYVYVLEDTPVRLWGLSSPERIRRVLLNRSQGRQIAGLTEVQSDANVLLLRGDYLFDERVLRALAEARDTVLQVDSGRGPVAVAAHVNAHLAPQLRDRLSGDGRAELPSTVDVVTPQTLSPAYSARLRKAEPPFVMPITTDNRRELEGLLFGAAYKGITDLVTKWVWPVPAQWGVRLATVLGLRPNHITAMSWILVIAAGLLFWDGHLGWGLALGWFMTYLDTVDGKLARVTLTSSRFGHLFDHILDLVHPPFWYLAWAVGLSSYDPVLLPPSWESAVWIIFVAYIGGRLVEGAFQHWLGRFGIFAWRRVDSYSRLVTARRNPSLVLLTLGALLGRPDLGLEAVAVWTLLSTLFLIVRLAMAGYARYTGGPLTSWLVEAGNDPSDRSLAVRWFAGGAKQPAPDGRRA
jgi:phosphatidylglycerophosphate synthase